MEALILSVAERSGLSREQAAEAVAAMLRYCTQRAPTALVGQLHVWLNGPASGSAARDVRH